MLMSSLLLSSHLQSLGIPFLEATNHIVKRNADKDTNETTAPSSTTLTEELDGYKDDNEVTGTSNTIAEAIPPPPNPLQRVTRSMRRIQKALGVPRVERIKEIVGLPRVDKPTDAPAETTPIPRDPVGVSRVDTPTRETSETATLPRVNGSKPPSPTSASSAKMPTNKPRLSARRERAAKSREQRSTSTTSPAITRSQSGPPAANTRSSKPQQLPVHTAMAVEELQQPRPKKPSKQARRLIRRIAQVESEVHEAMAVLDRDTGQLLKYRQLIRDPRYKEEWSTSAANEFGCLAQGVGDRIKGTNTMKFIHKGNVPRDRTRDATYASFLCKVCNEKKERNRTRLVVGGDRTNYTGEVATPTAEILVAKLLFNSVISTKGARFMTADISNFYLNTPLERPEYIRLKLDDIPEEIISQYKLRDKVTPGGQVYMEVNG